MPPGLRLGDFGFGETWVFGLLLLVSVMESPVFSLPIRLALTGFTFGNALVQRRGLPARDTQRLPLAAAEMFGEKNNLSAMVGIVGHLTIDRLHDRMRFAPYGDRAREIGVRQRFERGKQAVPALIPKLHKSLTGGRGFAELSVAIPARLLSVRRQKVR